MESGVSARIEQPRAATSIRTYRAETTSASISWCALVQYSPSLDTSPAPSLPRCATASFTNGPKSAVMGKRKVRMVSETMDMMPGTMIVAEESVSRWCVRMRCASSCARRMASSDVCAAVGAGRAGAGGGERPPKSEDHQEVSFGGGAGGATAHVLARMSSMNLPRESVHIPRLLERRRTRNTRRSLRPPAARTHTKTHLPPRACRPAPASTARPAPHAAPHSVRTTSSAGGRRRGAGAAAGRRRAAAAGGRPRPSPATPAPAGPRAAGWVSCSPASAGCRGPTGTASRWWG